MKLIFVVLGIAALLAAGCGSGVSYGTTAGVVSIYNGPTNMVAPLSGLAKRATGQPLVNGTYALSPSKMTLTVSGIGFVGPGDDASGVLIHTIADCEATYDRSLGSLTKLNASDIKVPVGTFGGIVVRYHTTYTVVMNDTEAGIYSDPDAPGHLTTTPPAGGPRPIQVRDQNNPGTEEQSAMYFSSPVTISADSLPQIYVVFDPTHWIKADYNNGQFSAPKMGGNPPIIPSMSSFGKAAFYSNIGTAMSYRCWSGDRSPQNGLSYLVLYADETTPVSITWQDMSLCSAGQNAPVVAFNGNGTFWGTYGMLGLDANKTLAWASASSQSGDSPHISGYSGVYKMQELSALGQTTTMSYHCTSSVPQPVSGRNYSSGAPDFTPDGTVNLTLLEN
jgi:hypothetical protein